MKNRPSSIHDLVPFLGEESNKLERPRAGPQPTAPSSGPPYHHRSD